LLKNNDDNNVCGQNSTNRNRPENKILYTAQKHNIIIYTYVLKLYIIITFFVLLVGLLLIHVMPIIINIDK
jgi:hypothetical protein